MVLLLGVVALLGYRGLGGASDGFTEYRRLARLNVDASDIVAGANSAEGEVFKFLDNIDNKAPIEAAHKVARNMEELITDAEEFASHKETRERLNQIRERVRQFNSDVDIVNKNITDAYAQYTGVVQQNAREMMDNLLKLGDLAAAVNNVTALNNITHSWDNLAAARSSLSRYAESRDPADGKRTTDNLNGLAKELEEIGKVIISSEGRSVYDALMKDNQELQAGMSDMVRMNDQAAKALGDIIANIQAMRDIANALNDDVANQMVTYGTQTLESNASAQTFMLGISAGGFILGIVLAILIVIGIVRVLNRVSSFALGIARGDFAQRLDVREKGEIGDMIAAMREIPAVLEKVTSGASKMANDILSGRFRNRLNPKDFLGSYANIANAVNTVGEAYTGVLDALPLPIQTTDSELKIAFLNKVGQSVLGGNLVGESCGKHFKGDVCGNSGCFGSHALKDGKPFSGECVVEPQGQRMDIAVTSIPLTDASGKVSGQLEIVNDLTEIRGKERTMLQVAREASDISDRVAAASEELSAQVEQVSRGAEMQRERVESTASAMTEMNATVLEVARSAGQASEQSELTRQRAEGGSELVSKVVGSINTVNTVAQGMQKNMVELGQQAESIGSVMSVISDIADQTNLLALNAAIEAARAGEAGRGFAVVADEVRKLAEKTMSATQEVGSNITSIQESTRKSMQDMENAARSVGEATELANESGSALTEIVELAAANSSVVTSIATAAEEQSATSDEINRAIDEISQVVGETTDGMVQSSAAVQELARMAQELKSVMERLK